MTFFAGTWGPDHDDDLVNAIAEIISLRAAEVVATIPGVPGIGTPSVHNVIFPRALAVNSICVDWGGTDIDEEKHSIDATIEIQYLYRSLQRDTADRVLRVVLGRIRRIIREDRPGFLRAGGWSLVDSALNVGTIADADFYENPNAQRYEGGKLILTMKNAIYRR